MKLLISELETLPIDIESRVKLSGLDIDVIKNSEDIQHPDQYTVVFGGVAVKKLGLQAFSNLKWIHISSAGFNHLPIQEWKDAGILLTNAKHIFSDPIAEYVLFYTLMHYKKGLEHIHLQNQKTFTRLNNRELTHQVVTVLGTGSLAQAIAKRFRPFNVRLIGINTSGKSCDAFDATFPFSEVKPVLAKSDIVVMTLPLNDQTKGVFDASYFQAMKQDSIFINVGRGRIIDEMALVQHLNSKHLAMAVLDVMETEPLPGDSVLWTTPNLWITPHDSGVSEKTGIRLWELFLRNVVAYQAQEPMENLV